MEIELTRAKPGTWILILALVLGLARQSAAQDLPDPSRFDVSAVTGLLDVMDLLVRKNPDYESTRRHLAGLSHDDANRELKEFGQSNADDREIKTTMRRVLSSPAYKLYYKQFNNVTPETHRRILCSLPIATIAGPSDISSTLMELCDHREAVRAWVQGVVTRVDVDRSQQIAVKWLPPGDYTLPPIRFVYDGNGDAFALDGEIVFDLFSLVLRPLPVATRFTGLGRLSTDRIELVLAHELQHIYAERYLYPPDLKFATWQDQWKDRLIRQIVSEGVAMQCDVQRGLRRTLMEDTVVVQYWIGQLNEKLAALRDKSISEDKIQAWFGDTFQDTARMLLNEYRKRVSPGEDSASYVQKHQVDRPTLVYTLGWWMVGRISEGGKNRDRVIALVTNPLDIFKAYNEALPASATALRVNF